MNEINKILTEAVQSNLVWVYGAKVTVISVGLIQKEAQEYTELDIVLNCESENNSICPSSQVASAVIETLKAQKKKVRENVPNNLGILMITVSDPGHPIQYFKVYWSDVRAYFDNNVAPDIFGRLITHIPQ